jgi:hypothetical protein
MAHGRRDHRRAARTVIASGLAPCLAGLRRHVGAARGRRRHYYPLGWRVDSLSEHVLVRGSTTAAARRPLRANGRRLQSFGRLNFWAYCPEGACSGIASAVADACSGIASAVADACSGIASAVADACSVAAADAASGSALAAARSNCLRLTHSQTATPIAPPANNTAPTTMDQRLRILCLLRGDSRSTDRGRPWDSRTPGKTSMVTIPHLRIDVCLILHRYPHPRPCKRASIQCYCTAAAYHNALVGVA